MDKTPKYFIDDLKINQSISHNGVCLSVEDLTNCNYTLCAVKETLEKTRPIFISYLISSIFAVVLSDYVISKFEMKGFIMDTTINEPIEGARIELTGTDGSTHLAVTDGNGEFEIPVEKFKEGVDYQIQFEKDWYFTQRDTISTTNIDRLDCKELEDGNLKLTFQRYVQMKSSKRPIVLPNVQYHYA